MVPCTETCGPNVSLPPSPLGLFRLLFTPYLIQLIVDNTNLYAEQVLSPENYLKFEKVTSLEIQAYFGFMLLMGINQLPCLYDYWRTDTTYFAPIASRITRARFLEISRFLHFVNNESYTTPQSDPQYDRIWKVRPVIDVLSKTFLDVYTPHATNSIDEAMIPFKGRSALKQYIPLKPIKRGIKVWTRADAENGYVSQFQVYLGKVRGTVERHLGERVVKDLTRPLIGRNFTIYCDNFFTSAKLFEDLLSDSIYACGTLRSDRLGYPDEFRPFLKKGLGERGKSMQIQRGNLLFSLWQDKKVVSALSTGCEVGEGSVLRREKSGARRTFQCPYNIIQYNKYMGGVDRNDQLRQYYCVRLKSRKFYKYIFWFLFELAVANSYVLTRYVPSTGHHCCHFVDYRLELAKQLIGDYNSRKRRGRPSTTISPQPLVSVHHFPMKAPTRSKCQRCSKRKVLKWTQWRCQACEKYFCHTGLPESDCFLLSHT